MSVPHSVMALLVDGPAHGYRLKTLFEERTGGAWPLNFGQIYTTLQRLERDGLVVGLGADHEGRVSYELTPLGREEVERWFSAPVPRAQAPRDELAIKIAMADAAGRPLEPVLAEQRSATLAGLMRLTALKRAHAAESASWLFVLDRLIFDAEAELRWLDHVEASSNRREPRGHPPSPDEPPKATSQIPARDVPQPEPIVAKEASR